MRSSTTKHRDMARSILPSRARSIPARLALARRHGRRHIAQELSLLARGGLAGEPDRWDDRVDLRAYPDIEIGGLVRWRRGADKLNHFERWAVAVTRTIPLEDRLSHLRGVLPGGLVGDHALSHLRNREELNPHHRRRGWQYADLGDRRNAARAGERERLRRAMVALLEVRGGHQALNTAIKAAATAEGRRPPVLVGPQDVDGYLALAMADEYGGLGDIRWRDAVDIATRHVLQGKESLDNPV